jgi:hypothetical protein
MKQTHDEADEALAHIRHNTAAPIQRFLDSIAAARLEETTSRRDRLADGPSRPGRPSVDKGLRRFLEALGVFRKRTLGMKPLARVIRRIRLRR